MRFNFNARNWHNWISVILVLPILIVAITAIFIAHHKSLKLESIDVTSAVSWLPGYQINSKKPMALEIRTSMIDKQGREWIGAQNGLFQLSENVLQPVKELAGIQIRDLVETPWGLVAATKMGVWLNNSDGWKLTYQGDTWSANLQGAELAVSVKDKGLIKSIDGLHWQEHKNLKVAMQSMPKQTMQERVSLEKLNMDLHTGKALFGKSGEWIWIDVIGFVLTFLSATGIYLWWRGEQRKKAALKELGH
jgi:hypothetical protein